MVKGTPKFDGLAAAEITINLLANPFQMSVKAAYVDNKTGSTCGWVEGRHWSAETVTKLNELRVALEKDLATMLFVGGTEQLATPSAPTTPALSSGLGEHLNANIDGDQV